MRLLLFITLIVSMAIAPAVASASCASMGADNMGADNTTVDETMAAPADMDMRVLSEKDCDMNGNGIAPYDAGCAAACALVCPGFYAGPDLAFVSTTAFEVARHAIPAIDPGIATPVHIDPPPPRL